MMIQVNRLALAIVVVSSLGGCANMSSGEQRTLSGTAIGTAAGALVGGLATGQPLHGAVLGAAAGAAGGWLYNRHEQAQEQ
jgi:osmotically inducible lipoprotein OsmB